jgi:GNAT superfamily N-acetyltransferase
MPSATDALGFDGTLDFYHRPRPHARQFDLQLKTWVTNLDPARDQGECSDGNPRSSEAWFYRNNFDVPQDGSSPLGTYFGVERETGLLVVMATLVVDDRGMRAKYAVDGDYMWGFVMTHHAHRQKRHGTRMCRFMDSQASARVLETGHPETLVLFTGYEPAVKIYTRLGYKFVRQVEIDDPGLIGDGPPVKEDLYSKTYA